MDGIGRIIERIKSDSDAECAAIAAEGAERRAEIAERYAREEKDAYGDAISKGAQEAAARFERLKSVAALEARKQVLAEKQLLLSEAFELAETRLRELPDGEYSRLLSRLAAEGARTGAEELILSQSDRERFGKTVTDGANEILRAAGRRAELRLSPSVRAMRGGVVVSGADIETNCSLAALVSRYKNELSPRVTEILFD
ncbi:MAG: V-type ATP synthase subunit E [Oscillospiraceae bacterium]|nr:V-type ATP synthase subunit E [Oscillospiraceae bacterium]